jgi:3-phosphoshikimate 1-carboxyvinyltransferase
VVRETLITKIKPAKQLAGQVVVPGDKSICHRAAILGSLASGLSEISNFSPGHDCLSTISCLRSLGVKISRQSGKTSTLYIQGIGRTGLREAQNVLNAGNSATTMRLLSGVLAAHPFLSIISGDTSLRARPMKRLIEPLHLMGAEIYGRSSNSLAPLVIVGGKLRGITYSLPMPSAQIKSAILLAGLFSSGKTVIEQSQISRDHTERFLKQMGAEIDIYEGYISLMPLTKPLTSINLCVPGDISSAAYWMVAGAIHPDARIKILNCGINPTRTGIIDVLLAMGAKLKLENQRLECNEPVADIYIESSQLKAIEIKGNIIPRLIDEIPVLAVAACFARGTTIIKDAGELRVKESDRIATTVGELSHLGARIESLPDGMVIHGSSRLRGNNVRSYSDHRLAMSLAIAGLVANGETTIEKPQIAEISYPAFWEQLKELVKY